MKADGKIATGGWGDAAAAGSVELEWPRNGFRFDRERICAGIGKGDGLCGADRANKLPRKQERRGRRKAHNPGVEQNPYVIAS